MKLLDLKKQHKELLDKAESFVEAAENANRPMSAAEQAAMDDAMREAATLVPHIKALVQVNSIRNFDPVAMLSGSLTPKGERGFGSPVVNTHQRPMSTEYTKAFLSFLRSGGKQASDTLSEGFDPLFGGFSLPSLPGVSAAMYEGTLGSSNGAGGYAISVPTDSQIVPLAVPDLGVRSVARAIPTATDIKIPSQSTFSTLGWKTESGASQNLFQESDPALSQFTLSAYMTGGQLPVSWELLQDVSMFQEFCVRDLLNAVDINEDNAFVSGTGTGQPQGLVGNTGTGTGSPYVWESTGNYLLNATDDILGTLKGSYFPNAAWLMSRATSVAIRKAQRQANLYAAVWTREGGRDFLHGYPVSYSAAMPAIPTATSAGVVPILFGSFKDGYIIGDRGGAGTFVKILDQVNALAGQTVLLAYKRVDGRVRRSEAIQAITISHS